MCNYLFLIPIRRENIKTFIQGIGFYFMIGIANEEIP